ncbi:hypothetical protein KAS50_06410, partial [bacterium]|nr:hypothetical protein [bacterium]
MLVRRTVGEKPHKNETLITRIGNYAYYNHLSYDPITSTAFRRLDTIHPEAVSKYVESLLGFLFDKFGYAFEKCVDAVWVDEPRCRNAAGMPKDSVAWTTILPGIFEKEWGYSLIDNLPLLFDDTGDYQKVRHHYWRTVCNMFTQTYWRLMEETCGKHGVRFSGHQYGEDTFGRQMEFTINCMPHYEYMQRPGIDHLTGTLTWPRWDKDDGYPFILAPKQASSVAHQLGKKEVLAEMFGVSDQGTSFEDRKWIFEWLAVLGINYRVYHAAFYSLRGNRKRVYPMTLNYQQPWWKHNRFADDHAARLCYALRQGKYKADILLIHPIESFYMNPGLGKVSPDDTGQLNMDFANISHNLLKIQRSYDYGDESLMAKYGKVKEKMLAVGEIDYKIVILPSIKTIRKSTFKLLTDFLNNGGTVISVGDMPTMIDGEESELLTGFNRRITQIKNKAGDLRISLDKLTPPDIRVIPVNDKPADTIWVQEQYIDKGQMFFLTNTSKEETIKTEFHIRGTGKLESWNLVSGKTECIPQRKAGDYIAAKLDFTPTESHLLVFNETEKIVYVPEKIRDIVRNIPVDSFKIERKEKNALTLDFCRYRKGSGNWSEVIPVVGAAETLNNEKYRGPVSMQFEYAVEAVPAQCAVVIEKADEFSVIINGAEIRYEGLPYYRDRCFLPIDITQYVKP